MRINLLDYHMIMDEQNVVLYYKGPFDESILAKISNYMRDTFTHAPKAGRKLFAVFVEMAQNIAFYSEETNHFKGEEKSYGVGTVVIQEDDQKITLTTGNLVKTVTVDHLKKKCEEINQLNYDELRNLKKEIRNAPRKEGHKGGNIGLIQMALKSDLPLEAKDHKVDDELSYFILSTSVLKEVQE